MSTPASPVISSHSTTSHPQSRPPRSTPPPPPYPPMSPKDSTHPTSSLPPPLYDPASAPSSSRPAYRRVSSQSEYTPQFSSSSTLSTAPTSPAMSMHDRVPRQWRPTPNVPLPIAHRHRNRGGNDDEERNRWLSEDEGLDGVARSIGRRRRRRSSGEDQDGSNGDDRPPDHSPDLGGPGPSTRQQRTPEAIDKVVVVNKALVRPKPRRVRSFEPIRSRTRSSSSIGATDITVGANPPQIQHIVPGPTSPVQTTGARSRIDTGIVPMSDAVPDYAVGRGGDGISGIGTPSSDAGAGEVDEATTNKEEQDALLDKLSKILGCVLCPPVDGKPPTLHHPLTLPCGHTLSAQHVSIPAPPPMPIASGQPHEIFAAEQYRHQQRLNVWASVLCPIPSCKRFSPGATTSHVNQVEVPAPSPTRVSSGAQRGEMLASGVTYYPPLMPAPPAYTPDASDGPSPLLDISVDKILHLVAREKAMRSSADAGESTDVDDDDDSSEAAEQTQTNDKLASPPSPLTRRVSKRRRNTIRQASSSASSSSDEWPFKKELASVLDCDVCAMMLYDPVTTPCQHSFCSRCLSRSLDHSSRCPLCRQDLPSFAFFQDHSVNRVLLSIMKTAFPAEYIERGESIEREERDARLDTPIFVCTLAFPGMPTILHVFEPRYRLMIRRCIESSSPRFGMLLPSRATGQGEGLQGVMEYGTMLEIQSVQMLPDGRSMVETVGTHRFKLLEKGSLDGYTIGRIERIDDISAEEDAQLQESAVRDAALRQGSSMSLGQSLPTGTGSGPTGMNIPLPPGPAPDDTLQTIDEYMAICRSFIEQLRSGSAPWLLQRLNNTYGTMPEDPSEFSYWMALVMPIDEYEKARLLPIRSPRLRLKLIVHWVESLRSSWWFSSGCVQG